MNSKFICLFVLLIYFDNKAQLTFIPLIRGIEILSFAFFFVFIPICVPKINHNAFSLFILPTIVRSNNRRSNSIAFQNLSEHCYSTRLHTNHHFRIPWYLFLTSCQPYPSLLWIVTKHRHSFIWGDTSWKSWVTFIPILTVNWNLFGLLVFFIIRIILDLQKSFQ